MPRSTHSPSNSHAVGVYARQSRDKTRSIDQQEAAGRDRAKAESWPVFEVYSDGKSASRFSTKARENWDRLLADLDAGRFRVLWLWESSRGDRTLESWAAMLSTCRRLGVGIYVETHGRLYDMHNPRDWRTLAEDGVDNAYESEKTSLRLRRDAAAAAEAGKPHGPCPYGYVRVYDPRTRALVEQAPDPETAPTVVEIFRRIAEAVPLTTIAEDLNERGVPSPGALKGGRWAGGKWGSVGVRALALNVAYIGQRDHKGEIHKAVWPPLIDDALWHAVQRVLSDPARTTTRPGKARHLLSYLAVSECAGKITAHRMNKPPHRVHYQCAADACVSVRAIDADAYIGDLVVARLSLPEWYEQVAQTDDSAVLAARAEVEALQQRLDAFRDSAAMPDGISPASLARV